MTDYLSLAAQAEGATEGSRELDAQIIEALGYTRTIEASATVWRYYGDGPLGAVPRLAKVKLPRFSTSLDAALSLVPEGYLPLLDATDATEGRNHAELYDATDREVPKACAASLPLALTAAALRALAADDAK